MGTIVRFAPSPTGRLHVGNARIALINWLYARARGGRFLLRIDDTDPARSSESYVASIEADLRWLGLVWDSRHRQSLRLEAHRHAFEALRAKGAVYPCYETADELEAMRADQRARNQAPRYDRSARTLGDEDRARLEAVGRRPHFRFALPEATIAWPDLVQGEKRFEGDALNDPVVWREDDRPTYLLASAVDDIDLGTTEVIRGEDHVTNTAVQIAILEALDARPPVFAHLALMIGVDGRNLSKRSGSLSLEHLRSQSIEPLALSALLATLGTGSSPPKIEAPDDLIDGFALERFGRAPPRFDPEALKRLSTDIVREMPFEMAEPRLRALGLAQLDAAFWEAVRHNLDRLDDVLDWWAICREPLQPLVDEPDYLTAAAAVLPEGEIDAGMAADWLETVKGTTGRKGKALYQPLRLALTAREHGPPLPHLLPLLGRERALARLRGQWA